MDCCGRRSCKDLNISFSWPNHYIEIDIRELAEGRSIVEQIAAIKLGWA
jgi:hypothetical protein